MTTAAFIALLAYFSYCTIRRQHAWTTSTRLWDRAYADGSRKPRVLVNLNSAYQQCGNFAKSQEWAQKALELCPDLLPVKLNLAAQLAAKGKGDEALAIIEEATRKTPKVWQGWHILAKYYVARQDLDKALNAYLQASTLRRHEDPELANEIAAIYFRQDRLDEALTFFENAWKLNPLNGIYAYNIGILHLRANRIDKAREWAMKIPPGAIVPGELGQLLSNAATGDHH